jgi:hypothetical protein
MKQPRRQLVVNDGCPSGSTDLDPSIRDEEIDAIERIGFRRRSHEWRRIEVRRIGTALE